MGRAERTKLFENVLNEKLATYLSASFDVLHKIQGRLHHISADGAVASMETYVLMAADLQRQIFKSLRGTIELSGTQLDALYADLNDQRLYLLKEIRSLRK